ncbi:MAG: DUF177 domain-containing protein [Acutalibacteraceae bacterium]|nr:DUF177 domain-containing protein [Acutalibacteraceae bacterium]
MLIDLKHIFATDNTSLPIEYSLDLSSTEVSGIYPLKKPVTVSGTVSNKASLVVLDAVITYEYDAPCDRCGAETARTHTIRLNKSLAVSIEGEESDSILTVPDMKLDLDELLYSEVIVSLPMKHLCKEDCKGICPKCGKNLNDGKCGCPEKEIDPRLSALAELLNN